MKFHKLEIGCPILITVYWYDQVPVPERAVEHEGEIIRWSEAQVVVRVRDYAVIRFWKRTGLEVGNPDHLRRGWRIDLSELNTSMGPAPAKGAFPEGIEVDLSTA